MNISQNSLAAAGLVLIIMCKDSNAFDRSSPFWIGKSAIVFAEKETKSKKIHKNNVILKGYDPVAYFKQGKAVKGNPSIASEHNGATYFFASKQDKAEFDRHPAKFEPQYGGFCANAMSKGKRNDIDPTVFRVYKNKLYVCSNQSAMKEFGAQMETNISKADQNWLKISPREFNTQSGDFESAWPFGPESSQQ